jgi:steroid 5-alpha reductase family enzyme
MEAFLEASLFVFIAVHLVAAVALLKKRNDWADVLWGPGQFLAALGALTFPLEPNQKLALLCLFVWAFRLFWYLGLRTLSHTTEDRRYLEMRQNWKGSENLQSYLKVFILQGTLMLINASPVIWIVSQKGQSLGLLEMVGALVWLVGFVFEAVADLQLKKFKSLSQNSGFIMNQGLWKYSRHPNYFGEITQWWGLYIMALAIPHGYLTFWGPLMITFFLLKISGIPLLEKALKGRPGYAEYAARTSRLIPLPPKKSAIS